MNKKPLRFGIPSLDELVGVARVRHEFEDIDFEGYDKEEFEALAEFLFYLEANFLRQPQPLDDKNIFANSEFARFRSEANVALRRLARPRSTYSAKAIVARMAESEREAAKSISQIQLEAVGRRAEATNLLKAQLEEASRILAAQSQPYTSAVDDEFKKKSDEAETQFALKSREIETRVTRAENTRDRRSRALATWQRVLALQTKRLTNALNGLIRFPILNSLEIFLPVNSNLRVPDLLWEKMVRLCRKPLPENDTDPAYRENIKRVNRWLIDRYLYPTSDPNCETFPNWGVNPGSGNVSICVMGPDGAGKSILGLHMASRYAADTHDSKVNVIYISTDLQFEKAEQMWGKPGLTERNSFDLVRPNVRKIPHAVFDFLDDSGSDVRHPNPYALSGDPDLAPQLELELELQLLVPNINESVPADETCIDTFLAQQQNSGPNAPRKVGFLDLAGNTAGDDWGYINRLLAQMPQPENGGKHLLVIDAIEGLEVYSGERDSYGEDRNRRSRVAQLVRSAAHKCHLVFIVEEAQQGQRLAEEFIADMVIRLRVQSGASCTNRTVEVVKSRAQPHTAGPHDYEIYSGEGTRTGGEENPDEPSCKNAYWHVFQNVDSLFDQIARRTAPIEIQRTPLPTFGITYLDAMLGHDVEPDFPLVDDPHLTEARSGQSNITALVGEVATYKTQLGHHFLTESFSERSWYRGWPTSPHDSSAAGITPPAPGPTDPTGGRVFQVDQILNVPADKRRWLMPSGTKESSGRKFRPVSVLLTTLLMDKHRLSQNIWECLPSGQREFLAAESFQNSERIICRRLPANEVSAAQFFHIVESAVREARRKMGMFVTNNNNRWEGEKECEAIRLVLDDWSTIKSIFPEVGQSPLLLQFLLQYFQWMGISVLIIDSHDGNPLAPQAGERDSDLQGRVGRSINAWHVRFFNEDRVAISIDPPPPFGSNLRPTVRELAPQTNDRKLHVDPHFESYDRLREGEARPLPLQVCLYAGSIGRNQYIDETEILLKGFYRGVNGGSIFEQDGANDYDVLRAAALAPRGQRLDHTRIVQVDEFWNRLDYFLPGHTESEIFCRAYLNARTIDRFGRPTPEDPYLTFQPAESTRKALDAETRQTMEDRRRHTFFQLKKLGYVLEEPPRPVKNQFVSTKLPRLDRIPMMWDFGFALHRRRAWRIAGDRRFPSLSSVLRKVDHVRMWLEGNALPKGGEWPVYEIGDLDEIFKAFDAPKAVLRAQEAVTSAESELNKFSPESEADFAKAIQALEMAKLALQDAGKADPLGEKLLANQGNSKRNFIKEILKSLEKKGFEVRARNRGLLDQQARLNQSSLIEQKNEEQRYALLVENFYKALNESLIAMEKEERQESSFALEFKDVKELLEGADESYTAKSLAETANRLELIQLRVKILQERHEVQIRNVGWYDFFMACSFVAQTQKRHGVPLPVLTFAVDQNGVESLSCTVLEIWASELKQILLRAKKVLSANNAAPNPDIHAADALLKKLSSRESALISNLETALGDLLKAFDQTLDEKAIAPTVELRKKVREKEYARASELKTAFVNGCKTRPNSAADKLAPEIKYLLDEMKAEDEISLIQVVENPFSQEALLRALLLMFGATEAQQFENSPIGPQVEQEHEPLAVATRHWYSTASRYMTDWDPLDPWVPFRLPGDYSVRGDWFLTIAGGSQSPQLAKGALDLLSSTRANMARLTHGVGLPTRHIGGLRDQRTALYTVQMEPHVIFDPATEEEVKQPSTVAPPGQDTDPARQKRRMRYGEVQAMGAGDGRPMEWLWRSRLTHYQRHSRIWSSWLNDMGRSWHQRTNLPEYQDLDAFKIYCAMAADESGFRYRPFGTIDSSDQRDPKWLVIESTFHHSVGILLANLRDATPVDRNQNTQHGAAQAG